MVSAEVKLGWDSQRSSFTSLASGFLFGTYVPGATSLPRVELLQPVTSQVFIQQNPNLDSVGVRLRNVRGHPEIAAKASMKMKGLGLSAGKPARSRVAVSSTVSRQSKRAQPNCHGTTSWRRSGGGGDALRDQGCPSLPALLLLATHPSGAIPHLRGAAEAEAAPRRCPPASCPAAPLRLPRQGTWQQKEATAVSTLVVAFISPLPPHPCLGNAAPILRCFHSSLQ